MYLYLLKDRTKRNFDFSTALILLLGLELWAHATYLMISNTMFKVC